MEKFYRVFADSAKSDEKEVFIGSADQFDHTFGISVELVTEDDVKSLCDSRGYFYTVLTEHEMEQIIAETS